MTTERRLRARFLAGLTVLVLTAGCEGTGRPLVPGLFGTWEWTGTSGGIAGDSRSPQPDDPRITVRFGPDGKALFMRDGSVAREQSYRLASEATIFGPDERPVLYFDDDELGRVVRIDEAGSTLSLSDNVYDGFSLHYHRVEE